MPENPPPVANQDSARWWAPLIVPATVSICTAIIGVAGSIGVETIKSADVRIALINSHRQKQIENGRAVIDIYFTRIASRGDFAKMTGDQINRTVWELKLLASVSDSPELKGLLGQTFDRFVRKHDEVQITTTTDASVTADQGALVPPTVPDRLPPPDNGQFSPNDFVAYPQAPISTFGSTAMPLYLALAKLGFHVQSVEKINDARSPSGNEVRYYHKEHKEVAQKAADDLGKALNTTFKARQIAGGDKLPNGVMEFWIGTQTTSGGQPK